MKTGMTRPVDSLGRIVIPKEIRNTFNLVEGTKIELAVEGDRIIITKSPTNIVTTVTIIGAYPLPIWSFAILGVRAAKKSFIT